MATSRLLRKRWVMLLLVAGIIFAGIQFIRPNLPNPPLAGEIDAPPAVKQVLESSCYNCHSNKTNLRWFDQVAPASWLVAGHIKEGRKALNFTAWDSIPAAARNATLYTAINMVLLNEMPLHDYLMFHPESKLSASDIAVLKDYVKTKATKLHADSGQFRNADKQLNAAVQDVVPEYNGIAYVKGWEHWKVISTTDRFDNGTMRVIYGNDIAIQAIENKQTNPWPDGSTFAKVAWDQLTDSSGNVRAGEFKQVEFMIKDKAKYAGTEGWGWGRWRGMHLKPYGKDAFFTTECTSCHHPMKDNDFVFTTPLAINK